MVKLGKKQLQCTYFINYGLTLLCVNPHAALSVISFKYVRFCVNLVGEFCYLLMPACCKISFCSCTICCSSCSVIWS